MIYKSRDAMSVGACGYKIRKTKPGSVDSGNACIRSCDAKIKKDNANGDDIFQGRTKSCRNYISRDVDP